MTSTSYSHILLDIEGTTCPVDYVMGTLFPYASEALETFFREHEKESETRDLIKAIAKAWEEDPSTDASRMLSECKQERSTSETTDPRPLNAHDCIPYIRFLISNDRKLTPLKSLQGKIWEEGYRRGDLVATLFDDAAPAIKRWFDQKIVISSYSSGSVQAQQLLYRHSTSGDLTPMFSHWFDTAIGNKKEAPSYLKICQAMGAKPQQILFISDANAELAAAESIGMNVCFSKRDGNPETGDPRFDMIESLSTITSEP